MNEASQDHPEIASAWDFNWGVMNVIIGGKSSIDLSHIRVKDWEDATNFLIHYGFNPDVPSQAKFIHAVIIESIDFIRKYLLPTEWNRGKRPPDEILKATDARQILLWASDQEPANRIHQAWACSILRVMHTIAHIEGVRRHSNIEVAREQIIARIECHVFKDEAGNLRFGDKNNSVPIYKVEWKRTKSRQSIIMKLLHKKGNVAETIYDLIGFRLVTEDLPSVMRAVKLLRDLYMITFPNCNPGRARNSLIDVDHFKSNLDVLLAMLKEGRINAAEFETLISRIIIPKETTSESRNPHSGDNYKSVQLTCRQLIYNKDPFQSWRDSILDHLDNHPQNHETRLIRELIENNLIHDRCHPSPSYGYFPFEIHILDKAAYLQNKTGDASHDRYKSSQLRAARRRVLGKILTMKSRIV